MKSKTFFNHLLIRVESFLFKKRLRLFHTIYINFRLCSFKDAIKLPIYIYGKVSFARLGGKVIFKETQISKGMIKIGRNNGLFFAQGRGVFILMDANTSITFNGPCRIGMDTSLRITEKGQLDIGKHTGIGDGVKIFCEESIEIGENTGIAFNSIIMDSNSHYMADIQQQIINKKTSPISIGRNNWIGNRSVIMKGTQTGNRCIVASGSLLNKDYKKKYKNGDNLLLVGTPAQAILNNNIRIFSEESERELNNLFNTPHNTSISYIFDKYINNDLRDFS